MSKTLAIFGATGNQGTSIINFILADPSLSHQYTLRALTRDTTSSKSQTLASKNIEVIQADTRHRPSLEKALTGAHTIFAMTNPPLSGPGSLEAEFNDAKTIADVAVEKGVSYIIFSSLPSIAELSGGKYTNVQHFEAKAQAEKYIRSLPSMKSAFFVPGFFMENFLNPHFKFFSPKRVSDDNADKWFLACVTSPQSTLPLIDIVGDTGKFIGAILASPKKFAGKTLVGATRQYSWEEITSAMSKATGKDVVARQVSTEEWKKDMPAESADEFVASANFIAEFGYFGRQTDELVAWAVENARGRPRTLEEFLEGNPLLLV